MLRGSFVYDNISKTLIVAYTNSNIDLVTDNNEIININDIKNKIISGDKAIYNLTINDGLAYLSCGFGIGADQLVPLTNQLLKGLGGINVANVAL